MAVSSTRESEDADSSLPTLARPEEERPEQPLLLNRQRAIRADWREVQDFLHSLSAPLMPWSFGVCMLSDKAIRRYNRRFRNEDHPTDVLSFPSAEHGTDNARYFGDILISAETARQNARRYGLRVEEEIKVLILHGLLHLLGYDHETDRGQMAQLERRWSARLGLSRSLTERVRKPSAEQRPPVRQRSR